MSGGEPAGAAWAAKLAEDVAAVSRIAEIFSEMVNGPDRAEPVPQWARDHAAFTVRKLRQSGFAVRVA